jgi:hypothetical protein
LTTAVEQDPRTLGQSFSVWTCANLADYLSQEGHLLVSNETIRQHLQGLDYRLIRPVLSISSRDPEYVPKVEKLDDCKAQARRGEI